ncbi:ABC transporter substrate-binding protein [Sneathiella marina]|uniref:ABC transporter substrate-binding protein n=1 Tax=Sneathiella marina TaxID=2950108 RepID=A0ABY4VXV9_9PROT|nr:ABC transporter substrate-binding protein [Sneathiella marina]USG59542.1 ABC transporter substrate-binding protein [Sneathiella marina]
MIKFLFSLSLVFMTSTVLAETPKRVVSVGGALTEIVYGLDAGNLLVGSDTTSYFPAKAAQLPKVGYQRTLSAEGILSLTPDLVILSDEAGPPAVLEQLKTAGVDILQVGAGRSLSDVKESIQVIAVALDKTEQSNFLISSLELASTKLNKAIAAQKDKKRIMFILQHSGGAPMVAGLDTAASSVIELSGAENAVSEYRGYKPLSPEAATAIAPDIILVTTQGLEQVGGKPALLNIPGINLTPAAKRGKVIAMDALLLLGFGPRTADAAIELNRRTNDL